MRVERLHEDGGAHASRVYHTRFSNLSSSYSKSYRRAFITASVVRAQRKLAELAHKHRHYQPIYYDTLVTDAQRVWAGIDTEKGKDLLWFLSED